MKNRTVDCVALFALLAGLFAFFSYAHDGLEWVLRGHPFDDFGTYYFSARLFDEKLNYVDLSQDEIERMKAEIGVPPGAPVASGRYGNAPLWLGMLRPLCSLRYATASKLWIFLTHLFLLGALCLLLEKSSLGDWGAVFFLVFSFQPLYENLALGQTNTVILLFLSGGIWSIARGRSQISAVFWALAAFVKPQFGLLFVFLLYQRQYRPFLTGLCAVLFLKAVSVLWLGWEIQASYLAELLRAVGAQSPSYKANLHNLSLLGALHRVFPALSDHVWGKIGLYALLAGIVLYVLSHAGAYRARGGSREQVLQVSMVLACILVVSPLTQEHHFVVLYVPLVALWFDFKKTLSFADAGLFGVSYLLLGLEYSLISFPYFYSGWSSVFYNGKLLGVFLLIWVLKRRLQVGFLAEHPKASVSERPRS